MTKRLPTAAEMATQIIADAENITLDVVGDIVEAAINSLIAPPLMPFVMAWAVLSIPVRWIDAKLRRGDTSMPEAWYPAVLGTATEDGRFYVGRLLKSNGKVTVADAVRFLVIEREATARDSYADEVLSTAAAREALIDFYEANRTLFDKAVAATGEIAFKAVAGAAGIAGSALKAVAHKIRKGV